MDVGEAEEVEVDIGPIIRGIELRDVFDGISDDEGMAADQQLPRLYQSFRDVQANEHYMNNQSLYNFESSQPHCPTCVYRYRNFIRVPCIPRRYFEDEIGVPVHLSSCSTIFTRNRGFH